MFTDQKNDSLDTQTRRRPLANVTNRASSNQCLKTQRIYRNRNKPEAPDKHFASLKDPSQSQTTEDAGSNRTSTASKGSPNRNSATMPTASATSGKGKRKTHIGPWRLGRTLGEGSTCRVRLAKHSITGQTAAIKIVSKKSATMVQSESIVAMGQNTGNLTTSDARQIPFGIEREVIIMKLIEHPNVISLYDVWENRGELYLVLEYVDGGELFDYISSNGALPEEEAVRLFRQIIAGLSYCHRLNICHRDMKPENILLDSRHNIKLADFGMAALQPSGHWLNTSCGSPHYAAPEIIHGRKYRGNRADVWSCGIILFALLAGFLPFDGSDVPTTLRLVKKGEYILPTWLSDEASDLIQCILQNEPEDRISMQDIWIHPLLKKYEKFHQDVSDHYVGPPPPLSVSECGPTLNRHAIDNDILQNLRKLWHGVGSEELVKRLLNPELNHERMLYTALVRFKEEQIENYQGYPLWYSASDYHHVSRPVRRADNQRSQSSHKLDYGPRIFRRQGANVCPNAKKHGPSQRSRVHSSVAQPRHSRFANTTRNNSGSSSTSNKQSSKRSIVHSVSGNQNGELLTSSPISVSRNRRPRGGSVNSCYTRGSSQNSRRSINFSSSYTRSASYHRNVSFRHLRKCPHSTVSNKTDDKQTQNTTVGDGPNRDNKLDLDIVDDTSNKPYAEDSPLLPPRPAVVRDSGAISPYTKNAVEVKKIRCSGSIWKDSTRQFSHELSQICEEAFNGSSSSTACDMSTCTYVGTPDTSVSKETPEYYIQHPSTGSELRGSSSPRTPPGLPTSSSIANLAESRRRLIEHSTKEGADSVSAHLSGVISHLDRFLQQGTLGHKETDASNRAPNSSLEDPFITPRSKQGYLPVITEEPSTPESSTCLVHKAHESEQWLSSQTTVSNSRTFENSAAAVAAQSTIRVVPRSSPGEPNSSIFCENDSSSPLVNSATCVALENDAVKENKKCNGLLASCCPYELDPVGAIPNRINNDSNSENRKWPWLKRRAQVPEKFSTLSSKKGVRDPTSTATVAVREVVSTTDEREMGGCTEKAKEGFFKKLMKKIPKITVEQAPTGTNESGEARNFSRFTRSRNRDHEQKSHIAAEKTQNWLARFFQIKPAVRVIALKTNRIKARRDVYEKLLEWQPYGMDQVYLDREYSIHGGVGENNFLRLRPVEFSAEFYTVLQHGQQANLSVLRFRQERGAASTFHRVVDTLCIVLKKRDMLVEDPVRAENMVQILDTRLR